MNGTALPVSQIFLGELGILMRFSQRCTFCRLRIFGFPVHWQIDQGDNGTKILLSQGGEGERE